MDISSKIGCTIVTLDVKEPDYHLIEFLNRKHPPLTPDLFPYYAGTLEDDEDDFYYDENIDFDETYQDELEALNNPSFEDIDKISKIVEAVESNQNNISLNDNQHNYEEITKRIEEIDKQIDIHQQKFNDLKAGEGKEKVEAFSVSEPVTKTETSTKVEPKPSIEIVEESINGNKAKFVVKANEKNKYYEDVLETVESLFEKKN